MNRILKNIVYHAPWLLSDKCFLELSYELHMGYRPDLDHPTTFNEKIQWLKLHDRHEEYAKMVDKFHAKEFAASIIGKEHIIQTLGVYDSVDRIDWDALPQKFVLKCTHDSGGLLVCRDKGRLDINKAAARLNKALHTNFWYRQREWAYKGVKPRIICEELMEDERQRNGLTDYRFFCFGGEPRFMYVSDGMEDHGTARISFTYLDGKPMPFCRKDYRTHDDGCIPLPENLGQMRQIAGKLAQAVGNPFIRVDLYQINGQVYFSELTFYPNGGYIPFEPEQWDRELGKMIKLQ